MGNPHRVIFVDGGASRLAAEAGPGLCGVENANIEFVERIGPDRYAAFVWERGAGLTQACGTGECAVAAAAVARGGARRDRAVVGGVAGGAWAVRGGVLDDVTRRGGDGLEYGC